jgi:hypothetical protein
MEAAATLLQAFARPFKLGRQAEEALEKIGKGPPMPPQMPPGAQPMPGEMPPEMPPGAPPMPPQMPPQASTPQAVGMPLSPMPVMS